jgi:hypothetical protein
MLVIRRRCLTRPITTSTQQAIKFGLLWLPVQGHADLISRRRNVHKSFGGLCADLKPGAAGAIQPFWTARSSVWTQKPPQFYDLLRRRGDACFYTLDLLGSTAAGWNATTRLGY